jgi:hypothetical protein
MSNAGDVHFWKLVIANKQALHIDLGSLLVDYDLHVYSSDGTLVGESTFDDARDHIVDIDAADPGTYRIYINSPFGEISDTPYELSVTLPDGALSVTTLQPVSAIIATTPQPVSTAGIRVPQPGTVLLADNFDDPEHGWMPSGPVLAGFVRYVDGEYQITKTDAASTHWPGATLPGVYTDSSIAMDVRFVAPVPANVMLRIGCRSNSPNGEYFGDIRPQHRTVDITRYDNYSQQVPLVAETPVSVIQRDAPIHAELTCVGTTISLAVNGVLAVSTQDATYATGRHSIVAGLNGSTTDVRISHLVVTQQ